MIKIVVASKNPVKLEAARSGFQKMFPGETLGVVGVSVGNGKAGEQPRTDADTRHGALTRAEEASRAEPSGDFWVGIEGGVEDTHANEMTSFAWIAIKSQAGQVGQAKTATFFLPKRVAILVRGGKELGDADDVVFGRTNSKQQMGAIGILTKNAITRTSYYTDAVAMALIPFVNPELYEHTRTVS